MENGRPIKVGIVGLGPVGMILASKLEEAGCDVALCIRNEVKRKKVLADGIVLENALIANTAFDKVYASILEFAPLDLDYLVFATKSYQVPSIMKEAAQLNTEKVTIVVAQNGIDIEEQVVPHFGEAKILRMVVNYAGNIISPNTVKVTFFTPPNYIGSISDARPEKAEQFATILNKVGMDTHAVDSFELLRRVWQKTILNSSLSALCGVGRLTMAEAMNDHDTVELIEQIINEAIEVAAKEKIHFPDDFVRQCLRYLKKGGDHFPSLAVDLIQGRQTEIDYFNGKIVEYGRKHYVRTSLNLSFTNMVKAMTNKNIIARVPGAAADVTRKILDKGIINKLATANTYRQVECFLGIDLGSAYSKFTVVDSSGNAIFRYLLPSMINDKQAFKNVMTAIASNFQLKHSCATGYGRKHFTDTDLIKTEINCAAAGVSHLYPGAKNIIDIGGEDIKVIRCAEDNSVATFYMNDKCAAGTGSFLAEVAEKANISIAEMSSMAALSTYDKELNSFCTVFAKTEIMNWIFDGMSLDDIARGIYISIANRVAKMRIDGGVPSYMIGGVIAHHPYLRELLNQRFKLDIGVVEGPQFVVSHGAAVLAMKAWRRVEDKSAESATEKVFGLEEPV